MRGRRWLEAAIAIGLLGSCGGPRRQEAAKPVAPVGNVPFQSYCAGCHQYDGQGMGDAPPLDRSPWVVGPETRLIRIVLHGLRGRLEIGGKTWDQEMPGFGPVMSDAEVASLLSYVRQRFGEPSAPVTAEAVAQVRAAYRMRTAYWSVEELDRP